MHFDAATQNKWLLGGVIAGVHFSARQAVRIVAGRTIEKLESSFHFSL